MDPSDQSSSAPVGEPFAPPDSSGSAKRSPLTAAILSFLWPGVGQLYAGSNGRGAILLAIDLFINLVFIWASLTSLWAMLIALSAGIAYRVLTAVDAWNQTRQSLFEARRRYYHWVGYAAVVLAITIVHGYVKAIVRISVFEGLLVSHNAMRETLLAGDRIVVDNTVFGVTHPFRERMLTEGRLPRRGEIVTFCWPDDEDTLYIGRVIGLGGETVDVVDNQARIDGKLLDEPYANTEIDEEEYFPYRQFSSLEIPDGEIFILLDNRDRCVDSRQRGTVPLQNVFGKARYIYYSVDREEKRVRWDRIGTEFTDPDYGGER